MNINTVVQTHCAQCLTVHHFSLLSVRDVKCIFNCTGCLWNYFVGLWLGIRRCPNPATFQTKRLIQNDSITTHFEWHLIFHGCEPMFNFFYSSLYMGLFIMQMNSHSTPAPFLRSWVLSELSLLPPSRWAWSNNLSVGVCWENLPIAACEFSFFCQIVAVDVDTSRITVQLHPSEEVSNWSKLQYHFLAIWLL